MMLERWDVERIYTNKGKVVNKIQQVNSLMETLKAQQVEEGRKDKEAASGKDTKKEEGAAKAAAKQ